MTVDPRVFQMRLDGLAQAMQETLFRTAVSPVVREGADASCGLFSERGELLALSDAIPLLLGALPGVVQAILAEFPPEDIRPQQIFCMNDPFLGGTHLPDITVMIPVFAQSRLVGFAASILHHQDVGGLRAGSVPPDAVTIFQEGLRLPPMILGQNGIIDRQMVRLIESNSRAPEIVLGDLMAQIASAGAAAKGMMAMCSEIGAERFIETAATCLEQSENTIAALFDSLPPGPFVGHDGLDPNADLPPCEVTVAITLRDGHLTADFTGSSPQVQAPVNCVRSGPLSAVLYAVLCLAGKSALRNGGLLRRIRLVLPEASVVNAAAPAAVNARMNMVRCITSSVLQAIAQAAPDVMPAANSGMSYVVAFSGTHADGRPFVTTEVIAGGAGGGPDRDGASAISTDVGNAMNMPAEALEEIAPVRLLSSALRRGSGGAGKYRGGDGISRLYEALADQISVSVRGERFIRVPLGLKGGGSPKPSAAMILRTDGSSIHLTARSAITLNRGDRLQIESCGGAGYGISENAD